MREFLLEKKRDDEQEYTLHLFEYCNLRCIFCWQDHENKVGIDDVVSKLAPIEEFLKKESRQSVVFNAMGGEIFADEIFDCNLLIAYKELALGIYKLGLKYNKKIKINWVTNLVTSKIALIESLLAFCEAHDINSQLVTSYDAKGRFNVNDFIVFKQNMEYFGKRIKCISMLLNNHNIKHILKDTDQYFKKLYNEGYYIYFDYYMPDGSADVQAPSDQQLYDVFKHLIDKYPNVHPIADWINNDSNKASCRSSKLVLADNTMCMCGNLVVNDTQAIKFYKSDIKPMDNSAIENSFLEKYDCASCEYLDRCTFGCFMQHDNKFREELDECVYKLTHRYIDNVRVRKENQFFSVTWATS